MNHLESLNFKPLHEQDIILLYRWFQEPTINQWYARNKVWSLENIKKKYLPRIHGNDIVPSFIIYLEKQAIGFIQYYSFKDHFPEGILDTRNSLFHIYQPHELVGLDLFIAASDHRGKGLGKQILDIFTESLPNTFRAAAVDPEINNYHAIRCYEKAGFKRTGYSEDKDYLLLMKTLR
ncbi:aminoglycoside 6'-N-acetyltransferase [Legionella steigerwaltii]|uniref:Aminoglycoside 6'-N-acetyltransferase n=1 Tax=Legionella steigerwaltii TaxID=460 RepID=A0A378LGZ2_9GAMM|nr:GNAT family N-acetyltransferase [Legionella steigerwaltii]KTD80981.1 aminoglycoside 6'-N-acetyltransferase [Legionella steigerwaltii]STY23331.1 aminoglycoside 6'-N-acetyltransferase [Legionella steigerwaltii]